jgi:ferrochelatase
MAPVFSADCVETLEEIQQEIRESFIHAGGEEFTYIPCLNAAPAHIDMMMAILERELAGWIDEAPLRARASEPRSAGIAE